jgi:hypothetical protein
LTLTVAPGSPRYWTSPLAASILALLIASASSRPTSDRDAATAASAAGLRLGLPSHWPSSAGPSGAPRAHRAGRRPGAVPSSGCSRLPAAGRPPHHLLGSTAIVILSSSVRGWRRAAESRICEAVPISPAIWPPSAWAAAFGRLMPGERRRLLVDPTGGGTGRAGAPCGVIGGRDDGPGRLPGDARCRRPAWAIEPVAPSGPAGVIAFVPHRGPACPVAWSGTASDRRPAGSGPC